MLVGQCCARQSGCASVRDGSQRSLRASFNLDTCIAPAVCAVFLKNSESWIATFPQTQNTPLEKPELSLNLRGADVIACTFEKGTICKIHRGESKRTRNPWQQTMPVLHLAFVIVTFGFRRASSSGQLIKKTPPCTGRKVSSQTGHHDRLRAWLV